MLFEEFIKSIYRGLHYYKKGYELIYLGGIEKSVYFLFEAILKDLSAVQIAKYFGIHHNSLSGIEKK